jgi:branched-chain amino acid transport system substrate-binding protein
MQRKISRRELLRQTTAAGLAAATTFVPMRPAVARQAKVKIGLLLPYTGTYAALGFGPAGSPCW